MRKTPARKPPTAKRVASACARAAAERKAEGIVILDLRELSTIADYFVIASGASDRQVRAVAEAMNEGARETGARCYHSDGWGDCSWVVLDFADVIAHVFQEGTREHYQIERLWGDAKRLEKW